MKKSIARFVLALAVIGAVALDVRAAERDAGTGAETEVGPALREQSIYVPYGKLWQVFEKEGRGVFLPYEEFLDLWQSAEKARPRPVIVEPPVDWLVTEVSGTASVAQDVVSVAARVRLEVLKEGWHEIPVRMGDVAITRATVGGQPARLVRRDAEGYALLLDKQGEAPEVFDLELEFAKSYAKAPGRNSVQFQTPLAPISRWDVRIPEAGVAVDIQPLLAATESPDAGRNETRILAFVGATPTVRIDWTPKAEGARGLKALANVKAEHEMWIEEGVSRTRVTLAYDISRTELDMFEIEVPTDQKVVNVFDPNVREWSVDESKGKQIIDVQLFEATKGAQSIVVELEKYGDGRGVAVPVVRALDVSRQQGVVVVKMGAGLRAETGEREGLLQLDAQELPGALARGAWDFSYRYAALPFLLVVNVDKVEPRILADTFAGVHLQPRDLTIDFCALYDIQRAGVFQLSVLVPDEFSVRDVRGVAYGDATAVAVDTHHLAEADEEGRRLVVNLSRKAEGKVGLSLRLYRSLREPDLLSPTGKAALIDIPVPRVGGAAVERETGRLVVYGPESLRINPAEDAGLRPISHAEAVNGMPPVQRGGERPVLSFAYADEATALKLAAERRPPHMTVRQLLLTRIDSGVVKYQATFTYDILYSGVKALRLDLPAALADKIRIASPGVRRTVMDAAGLGELAEGAVAWQLEGETEFVGSREVRLEWEEKTEELEVGETMRLDLPRLTPRGMDRAWGQIVLAKAEAIDVVPGSVRRGLRPIDPHHDLMPGVRIKDAARAFEFHADWELSIDVTRYEPKDVKATSIESGLVRMVITRSDVTSVQALYRMRSARQRLVVSLPGDVRFDTQPVRINGRPVTLEQGEAGEYFVPLVGRTPDQAFLLELRYVLNGAGLLLLPPAFPREPAVQQVYLSVFLPEALDYLGSLGPWNDEMVWVLRGFNTWPRGNRSSDALLRWVAEGVPVDARGLSNFATDGRHLLFSTLRPVPGPAGALRIVAARGWILQLVVIVLIAGLGLLLLPARLGTRAVAVGMALIVLVLDAVFAPSFVRAMVNNATVGAGIVVLVVWAIWFLVVTLPRDPGFQERRRARDEARTRRKLRRMGLVEPPPPVDESGEAGGESHE